MIIWLPSLGLMIFLCVFCVFYAPDLVELGFFSLSKKVSLLPRKSFATHALGLKGSFYSGFVVYMKIKLEYLYSFKRIKEKSNKSNEKERWYFHIKGY